MPNSNVGGPRGGGGGGGGTLDSHRAYSVSEYHKLCLLGTNQEVVAGKIVPGINNLFCVEQDAKKTSGRSEKFLSTVPFESRLRYGECTHAGADVTRPDFRKGLSRGTFGGKFPV